MVKCIVEYQLLKKKSSHVDMTDYTNLINSIHFAIKNIFVF